MGGRAETSKVISECDNDHLKLAGKRGDGIQHSSELLHRKGKAVSAISPPIVMEDGCSLCDISSWSSSGSDLTGRRQSTERESFQDTGGVSTSATRGSSSVSIQGGGDQSILDVTTESPSNSYRSHHPWAKQ